ncbi:LysM peptidoglycan-binding domain-containing protein [uncultured Ruegeria sp.]|uniref:LysM peptidoglycan-binding domain-containing protein n=1 Tax=uncultured Ruegeria sp. TaxID=259304 RepID=UPI00262A8F4C|nr:LysM peptidoglycan-binding domain-containing protein [uncultured Ruegeria sp.]
MNIEILQPKPFDIVGSTIMIAGNAVGFEGHLSISVSEGHVEFSGAASAGAIALRQFQAKVEIPANPNFQLDRLFVTVTDDSGGGEGVVPTVHVPVFYGPRILTDYVGYRNYTVAPGDTLSSISTAHYGNPGQVSVIQRANAHLVDDPNVIFPGQEFRIPIA